MSLSVRRGYFLRFVRCINSCRANHHKEISRMKALDKQMSEAEWERRCELAACHRIAHRLGFSDLIWNHITTTIPGEKEDIVLAPRLGLTYNQVTASNLVKVIFEGLSFLPFQRNPAQLDLNTGAILDSPQQTAYHAWDGSSIVNFTGLVGLTRPFHQSQSFLTIDGNR